MLAGKTSLLLKAALLITVTLLVACERQTNSVTETDIELSESQYQLQAQQLEKTLINTPYSALVKITSVKVKDLPDADKTDDFAEQILTFSADVIETYRGTHSDTLTYTMIVEKGESIAQPKGAFIVALCSSDEGLYWPGVGAVFSADKRLIELASKTAELLEGDQVVFDDCVGNY